MGAAGSIESSQFDTLEEHARAIDGEHSEGRKLGESTQSCPIHDRSPFGEYKLQIKVGDRKFVKVYKAVLFKNDKSEVAIKEINGKEMPKSMLWDLKYQLSILTELSHPAFLKLHAVYEPAGIYSKFFVVSEYLRGGEIVNAIIRNNRYTEDDILFYASQLVSGVHFLHSKGIAHGNLIPENIVLSHANFEDRSQNHVKIVGFENAEWVTSRRFYNKKLSMDEFQSPELLEKLVEGLVNVKPTKEGDIWSVGKILQFLITGDVTSSLSMDHINPTSLMSLIPQFLVADPANRPTSSDLLYSFLNCRESHLDLSSLIPSLVNFMQLRRSSYSLKVSAGVVHFHRGNRYEEEKVFASLDHYPHKQ